MAFNIERNKFGLFPLLIQGAEDAPNEEIEEVFGRFGPVLNINRVNNKIFIHYNTKEEAETALNSMENDSKYQVKTVRKQHRRGNMNNSQATNQKRKCGSKFENGRSEGDSNQRGGVSNLDELQERRSEGDGRSEDDFNQRGAVSNSVVRTLPKLVPILPTAAASENLPKAIDVMIGNLPANTLQGDVYKLCIKAKSEPVHIEMRTIHRPPGPKVYYAQAFFKTVTEAKNIVQSLHKLVINGHQLVVKLVDDY